jgi:hypothetical protein
MKSSQLKVLFVSLLAVFAVSAVASATASATANLQWEVCEENKETPKEPPTKYDEHKCNTQTKALSLRHWEWKVLEAGKSYETTSSGGKQILKGEIGGAAIEIECESVEDTGTIEGGKPGKDKGTVHYHKCHIIGAATCGESAKSPGEKAGNITLKVKTVLVEIGTGTNVVGDKFEPEVGTTFVEIELGKNEDPTTHKYKEKCGVFPLAAQKVTGVTVGKAEPGVGGNLCEKLHFTNPAQAGSTLKLEGITAIYEGEVNFKLVNEWAFRCS